MFFLASKLLGPLLMPGNLLAAMGGVGLVCHLFRRLRGTGRFLLGLSAAGFVAFAILPIGEWMIRPLETRFPQPPLPATVDGIILLGGALDPAVSAVWDRPTLTHAGERILVAPVLARRYPEAPLVFTGGSGALSLAKEEPPEAPLAHQVLTEWLQVPAERLILEAKSRNTIENAAFVRDLVRPSPGETWLLVTSAWHMPRAMGVFRAAGWSVIPYPVDYRSRGEAHLRFDLRTNLDIATLAAKEWVGLTAYWLTGRTSSLFPVPGTP